MVSATNEAGLALKLLKKFQTLNADLASQVSALSKRTLLELASSATESTAIKDMQELFATLGSLKDPEGPAVFYILDEHNELYQTTAKGLSPLGEFPNVLHGFTRWTGLTTGVSKQGQCKLIIWTVTHNYCLYWVSPFKI